jgi:hypothetical protein
MGNYYQKKIIMYKCIAKAKLDDICANYFAKQKRHRAKQGISAVVTRKEIRDNGAKVEDNNQCTPCFQKGFGYLLIQS